MIGANQLYHIEYKNFTLTLVGAFANPHKAVQQAYNRTSTFSYGMVYIAYSF